MKKKILTLCIASLFSVKAAHCAEQPGVITIPNQFHVHGHTALDNISVQNVTRGITYALGIALFYHAADNLALSFKIGSDVKGPEANDAILNQQYGRRKVALAYFLTGCAFTAAGLIQQYGSNLAPWIRNICGR